MPIDKVELTDLLENTPIQRGIPIPPKKSAPRLGWATLMAQLGLQDSFTVPAKKRQSISAAARKMGIIVTIRIVDSPPDSVRVWRVK